MDLASSWEKLPSKRKILVFLFLGAVAITAIALGLFFSEESVFIPDEVLSESTNAECSSFITSNSNIFANFFHEGLSCNNCTKLDDGLSVELSECDNLCTAWIITGTLVDPVQETCDEINIPPDLVGSDFVCPPNTYFTRKNTGCIADSIRSIKILSELCIHLEEEVTLETCFDTCENIDNCGGISISQDGEHCFVFTKEAHEICNNEVDNQNVCKPINDEVDCFNDRATYGEAIATCESFGQRLAFRPDNDDFDVMLRRIARSCGEVNAKECFFDGGDDQCRFVDDGLFNVDSNCDDRKSFCCETVTDSPTVSPTLSPTEQLFFICEEENGLIVQDDFEAAKQCCLENGADLAAITSQTEQDFAFEVCSEYIEAQNGDGDCGCWIGVDRIGAVVTDPLDPDNFKYTDGSGILTFSGFEQAPEIKPDNQDDRNEECVHMRPFSNGGWNDLPCDGNCDARDTKPVPLCRLRTPSPTSSPTRNPTQNPTFSPTFFPTAFPTLNPTENPTGSPTRNPTRNPTANPTRNPTKNPTVNPTTSPTENPTGNPTANPTQNPTKNPTANPTGNPTKNPTANPTGNPTQNPTQNPTANPTANPTQNPTKNPTANPTANPTKNPTANPTANPTKNPTANPTGNPTQNPTKNPTANPTANPTQNPTKNPTSNPSRNPTANPTANPTENPTVSPTKNPTINPTINPTLSPTGFPTRNPTANPTSNPTANPTKNPTANPTGNPTRNPTKNPTQNPTANPTANPTGNPTQNPTSNPTQNPTGNPTQNPTAHPTRNPTANPTANPTRNPTKNPTQNPTANPTANPTGNPTKNPTNNPTQNPTGNPTQNPTGNPTKNPTKNPTNSPTSNPTANPTQNPTGNPTSSPTRNPTSNPTQSPTPNPTRSPTYSPIRHPDDPIPCCHYGREEYIWKFTNPNDRTHIPFIWFFRNKPKRIIEATEFFGRCEFQICIAFPKELAPGETYEFRSPTPEISVEFPCDQNDPFRLCDFDIVAPVDLIECECDNIEFFADDFESYPAALGISPDVSPEFFEIYEVPDGTVDIKGLVRDEDGNLELDEDGEPFFLSGFFFNPCLGTQCVDIDGTLAVQPEEVTLGLREVTVDPSNAFFNRICSLNFHARGNGRCGALHQDLGIINRATALANGCFQFSTTTVVPLFDNLTATITEGGAEVAFQLFENIEWDQPYMPYGLTADVNNLATSVGASFTVDGSTGPNNLGGNIGPLIDEIDLTCCCPEEDARYIGAIVDVDQGTAFNGLLVPSGKSDYHSLVGHVASYLQPFTFSLGLSGSITIKLTLGVTHAIRIYEESYLCCNAYDPEDARVEVSVDGINFLTVAESLKGRYKKVLSIHGDHIRYADVLLPNGACFKYIRLTDTSEADAAHCDGFDLVSIEVLKPCCPTNLPEIATDAPTTVPGVVSSSFAFGGESSNISIAFYALASVAILVTGVLQKWTFCPKKTSQKESLEESPTVAQSGDRQEQFDKDI